MDGFPFIFLGITLTKNSIAQEGSELAVSQIIEKGTIYGMNFFPIVPLQRRIIGIHKGNAHFLGNFLHRIHIESEVFIL